MRNMKDIDFLPKRITGERTQRRRIWREVYLLGCCALALVVLGYVREGRVKRAQGQVEILYQQTANTKRQLEIRNQLKTRRGELKILQRIEADLGSRIKVLDVLAELERVTPESVALTKLSLETRELKVPVKTLYEGRSPIDARSARKNTERTVKRLLLVIKGLSPTDVDVANFIGQMSASPVFEDVNMGYTRNVEFHGRRAREFQASCYIVR